MRVRRPTPRSAPSVATNAPRRPAVRRRSRQSAAASTLLRLKRWLLTLPASLYSLVAHATPAWAGGFVEYDRALDVANVYTKRPIAKGEEIFEMYGVWPMGDTLHNAGYLPADVGADCAAVRFEAKQFIALNDSALREADKRELKAAMCEAAGIEVGPFTTCVPPHTPERARQLRDFFRAAAAAEVVEEAKTDGDEDKLVKVRTRARRR